MSEERSPAPEREAAPGRDELAARLELLREENERLRREYARARRTRYRRTAIGLGAVGLVNVVGALVFPELRAVLLALGATGLFGAVLTYYLTPERFIPASVGERVYDALAGNQTRLVEELGLTDTRAYVPREATDDPVRLFVPQHADYGLPEDGALDAVFVVTDEEARRGVSLRPTGLPLFDEFERALAGPLADDPEALAEQLVDGLIEQFELAESATVSGGQNDRVTIGVDESAYGDVTRFDHPVASFLAVGIARGLDRPVTVEVARSTDDRHDYLVTCAWGSDTSGSR